MRIYKEKDYRGMSQKAANIIASEIILNPECVLGLATGSTPINIYENLVSLYNNDILDFSGVKTVNLDEYKGIMKTDKQSYFYFMNDHLFSKINISKSNINIPDGMQENVNFECSRYENCINELGGIDLQLLGIGHNGHIGFNEPNSEFERFTHCVNLSENTINANKRFFLSAEDVPRQAYTMGIKTIMKAKKIILVVAGSDKSEIIAEALEGPITPKIPASVLQLHPDVVIVGDADALKYI